MFTSDIDRHTFASTTCPSLSMRPAVLAVVAHDLRQPTSSALMAAEFADELVGQQNSEEMLRKQLALIERCMHDALRMTDDLLTVGQLEFGALQLQRSTLDLGELLWDVADKVSGRARVRGVNVEVASPGPLPFVADRRRLRQVLSNLCDNAVKFTPRDGIVRLRATVDDAGACISVSDSGPGLPDAKLQQLFDQYWQEDHGAVQGSVGLGLTIARSIVEMHEGSIAAANAPGGGLIVSFMIPRWTGHVGEASDEV